MSRALNYLLGSLSCGQKSAASHRWLQYRRGAMVTNAKKLTQEQDSGRVLAQAARLRKDSLKIIKGAWFKILPRVCIALQALANDLTVPGTATLASHWTFGLASSCLELEYALFCS